MQEAHFQRVVLQSLAGLRAELVEMRWLLLDQQRERLSAVSRLREDVSSRNAKIDQLNESLRRSVGEGSDQWWSKDGIRTSERS